MALPLGKISKQRGTLRPARLVLTGHYQGHQFNLLPFKVNNGHIPAQPPPPALMGSEPSNNFEGQSSVVLSDPKGCQRLQIPGGRAPKIAKAVDDAPAVSSVSSCSMKKSASIMSFFRSANPSFDSPDSMNPNFEAEVSKTTRFSNVLTMNRINKGWIT